MRRVSVLLAVIVAASAEARIGETAIQFADRYGGPRDSAATKASDKTSPLLEGAIHHTYEYQGWIIRAAFLEVNGPAVRMTYRKLATAGASPVIQDYELEAIKAANTPAGSTWKQVAAHVRDSPNKGLAKVGEAFFLNALGERAWQRTDGAILALKTGKMIAELELPLASQHEQQLKAAKEQKARESVPKF